MYGTLIKFGTTYKRKIFFFVFCLGDKELTPEAQVNVGNIVTSELTFVPKPTDNGKEIKCAATNEASVVANETKITLTVYCKYYITQGSKWT